MLSFCSDGFSILLGMEFLLLHEELSPSRLSWSSRAPWCPWTSSPWPCPTWPFAELTYFSIFQAQTAWSPPLDCVTEGLNQEFSCQLPSETVRERLSQWEVDPKHPLPQCRGSHWWRFSPPNTTRGKELSGPGPTLPTRCTVQASCHRRPECFMRLPAHSPGFVCKPTVLGF